MKRKIKRTMQNQDGAAMVIALVIMVVVIALSLSLLLVSYNLIATVNKKPAMEQCRILAHTLSRELEREITGVPVFSDYEAQEQAQDAGKYPLYFYLRYNVGQTSWRYYNSDEWGHSAAAAVRSFDLNIQDQNVDDSIADALNVEMYWEGYADTIGSDWESEHGDGTVLQVIVTCQIGNEKCVVSSAYELGMNLYMNEDETEEMSEGEESTEEKQDKKEETVVSDDRNINPDHNAISKQYCWTWSATTQEQGNVA